MVKNMFIQGPGLGSISLQVIRESSGTKIEMTTMHDHYMDYAIRDIWTPISIREII